MPIIRDSGSDGDTRRDVRTKEYHLHLAIEVSLELGRDTFDGRARSDIGR